MLETTPPAAVVPTAELILVATPTHVPGSGSGASSSLSPTPLPAGQILPADQIKGKLTLRQVSEQCMVSLDALLTELELPTATDSDTAIKDLVAQGALTGVAQVQSAVAKLQGK